jgi:hypothetical protein
MLTISDGDKGPFLLLNCCGSAQSDKPLSHSDPGQTNMARDSI